MIKPFVFLGLLSISSSLQAQGLADVARHERVRKQNVDSKITVTTDTLKPGAAGTLTKPIQQSQAATLHPPQPTGPTDRQGRDEKYWRAAFAAARQELARAEMEAKVAEGRVTQANRDLLQRSNVFNNDQIAVVDINAANANLKAAKQNAQTARATIIRLEEELRRSGGPAGWAR